MNEPVKIASNTRPLDAGASIKKIIVAHGSCTVQAIGATAVSCAVKALIYAQKYLNDEGLRIANIPEFVKITIDGEERTAIRLIVFLVDR